MSITLNPRRIKINAYCKAYREPLLIRFQAVNHPTGRPTTGLAGESPCYRRALGRDYHEREDKRMAALDWSQCSAVESVPGRLGGAWVFRDTRMPVSAVFENLEAGATIDEIIDQFDVTREQIHAVLEFAARSLDSPLVPVGATAFADAHSL